MIAAFVLVAAALGVSAPEIAWRQDYATALAAARKADRPLLVQFVAPGRPLSARMVDEVLRAPAVVAPARDLVAVKLDAAAEAPLFARLVGGPGAVATCLVETDEDILAVLPGAPTVEVLAAALIDATRARKAVRDGRKKVQRRPSDLVGRFDLASLYMRLGSPRRAEDEFRRLLVQALAPRAARRRAAADELTARAHERLARLLIERGRIVEAREQLARAAELDEGRGAIPGDALLLTRALVAAVSRDVEAAGELLRDARARYPRSAERAQILFVSGQIAHELRDDVSALAWLGEVVASFPGTRWAAAARDQIEHVRNPPAEHVH